MDDAAVVCECQRVGRLRGKSGSSPERQEARRGPIVQRLALHVLHGDERPGPSASPTSWIVQMPG